MVTVVMVTGMVRVMVVCLAPTHPLLTESIAIKEIEFQIGRLDRADNTVSGRFKST